MIVAIILGVIAWAATQNPLVGVAAFLVWMVLVMVMDKGRAS